MSEPRPSMFIVLLILIVLVIPRLFAFAGPITSAITNMSTSLMTTNPTAMRGTTRAF